MFSCCAFRAWATFTVLFHNRTSRGPWQRLPFSSETLSSPLLLFIQNRRLLMANLPIQTFRQSLIASRLLVRLQTFKMCPSRVTRVNVRDLTMVPMKPVRRVCGGKFAELSSPLSLADGVSSNESKIVAE